MLRLLIESKMPLLLVRSGQKWNKCLNDLLLIKIQNCDGKNVQIELKQFKVKFLIQFSFVFEFYQFNF